MQTHGRHGTIQGVKEMSVLEKDRDAGYRDRMAGYYDKWYRYNRKDDGAAYDQGFLLAAEQSSAADDVHFIECAICSLNIVC